MTPTPPVRAGNLPAAPRHRRDGSAGVSLGMLSGMLIAIGVMLPGGCRTPAAPPRPSIEQVYTEALNESLHRRENPPERYFPSAIQTPVRTSIHSSAATEPTTTRPAAKPAAKPDIRSAEVRQRRLPRRRLRLAPIADRQNAGPVQLAAYDAVTGNPVVPVDHSSESGFDAALRDAGVNPLPVPANHLNINDDQPILTNQVPNLVPAQSRINESFDATDVREAIAILASVAGRQVLVDDTVGGLASAEIIDATWDQALQQLLDPLGYIAVVDGRQTIICPPDPTAPLFGRIAQRATYEGRYQNVTAMTELLPARYQPFLNVSEDRNLVSIDAPPPLIGQILDRLSDLDRPVPQVELEAIVCVVSPESGLRFGLDWNHVVDVNGGNAFTAGITGLSMSGAVSPRGIDNLLSDFSVTSAFIRALAREGYLSIRAAPRVTARDGKKAEISIARETFFSLQPTSANVLFRQEVQKVEAGIGLDITPKIRGDVISLQIDRAEVSENIQSGDPDLNAIDSPFPTINRRTVSTNVDARNGETVVIGGLVQRQNMHLRSRVPGLSKIPLIGRAFETLRVESQDVEVVIFISPRLVD